MRTTTFDALPEVFPEPSVVQHAVIRAVAYADVFDYPLRAAEIHQYLHGVVASWAMTKTALEQCAGLGGALSFRGGFYTLRGREGLGPLRRTRRANSRRLWPSAVGYGRLISRLPFVRMVAVTGSLAWDNVANSADIDYLVVTEAKRLWLCRWLLAALTRIARRSGVSLCINYILSERALALAERDLYTAYELVRMRPIAGLPVYRQMRELNTWTDKHLPNALEAPAPASAQAQSPASPMAQLLVRTAGRWEWALRSWLGAVFDWVELRYRVVKMHVRFSRQERMEMLYSPDCYKTHRSSHRQDTLAAFAERVETVGANAR